MVFKGILSAACAECRVRKTKVSSQSHWDVFKSQRAYGVYGSSTDMDEHSATYLDPRAANASGQKEIAPDPATLLTGYLFIHEKHPARKNRKISLRCNMSQLLPEQLCLHRQIGQWVLIFWIT
jgi:hypothetical protein